MWLGVFPFGLLSCRLPHLGLAHICMKQSHLTSAVRIYFFVPQIKLTVHQESGDISGVFTKVGSGL
jgi:hypothetical protein